MLGVAASCSVLSMCIPPNIPGQLIGLTPGSYLPASAEHQYQFAFQHPLHSGP